MLHMMGAAQSGFWLSLLAVCFHACRAGHATGTIVESSTHKLNIESKGLRTTRHM